MVFTTLIDSDELARNLDNPRFVIFDCRHELTNPEFGDKAYAHSHLPKAHFASVDRDLSSPPSGSNGRHPMPSVSQFSAWLGSKGVSNGVQVIGYDNAAGVYASDGASSRRSFGTSTRSSAIAVATASRRTAKYGRKASGLIRRPKASPRPRYAVHIRRSIAPTFRLGAAGPLAHRERETR